MAEHPKREHVFSRSERVQHWMIIGMLVSSPVFGAVVSVSTGDWTWFARSGSVVVMIAVLAFGLAYVSDVRVALHGLRPDAVSVKLIKRELKEQTDDERLAVLDELVTELEGAMTSQREAIQNADKSLKYYKPAIYAAFFGTLIWGFGDLVGLLFQ